MNRLSYSFYRSLLWLWDWITLNAVLLALDKFLFREINYSSVAEYQLLFYVSNAAWLASVFITALYLSKNWLDFVVFLKRTSRCYLFTLLSVLLFIFFYKYPYSRLFIFAGFTSFALALIFNRFLFQALLLLAKNRSNLQKKVVVLGDNTVSRNLINYFTSEAKFVEVAGWFAEKPVADVQQDGMVTGTLAECMPFVLQQNVTEIYSTLSPELNPGLYELAIEAEKNFVRFKFVLDYHLFVNRQFHIDFVDDYPVLSLRRQPLEDTGNRIKKRIFDIVFSLLVIVLLLSWLIPLLAILIKLDSKGPVFFTQMRSGKSNEPFRCIKFRSLRTNNSAPARQVTRNDSRVTRLGKFIRKTNIDELPQFFNVLIGNMSVVGPRPHMLKHTEDFSMMYKHYMIRHFVKPGLTGQAQVKGFRGEITDPELLHKRVEEDIWYLENWSITLDIKIIMSTVLLSIRGDRRAY